MENSRKTEEVHAQVYALEAVTGHTWTCIGMEPPEAGGAL